MTIKGFHGGPEQVRPEQGSVEKTTPYEKAVQILGANGFKEVERAPPRSPYDLKAKRGEETWFVVVRSRTPQSHDSHRFIMPTGRIDALKTTGKALLLLIRGTDHRVVDASTIDETRLRSSVIALSLKEPGKQWNCLRCEHRWRAKGISRPTICPRCKSPYYDRPRKRSTKSPAEPGTEELPT